jgi:hypothetical protein
MLSTIPTPIGVKVKTHRLFRQRVEFSRLWKFGVVTDERP